MDKHVLLDVFYLVQLIGCSSAAVSTDRSQFFHICCVENDIVFATINTMRSQAKPLLC
jgi:hypothetical protein